MTHPSDQTPTQTTIRLTFEPGVGLYWRVIYGCGCAERMYGTHRTAAMYAAMHRCPQPFGPVPSLTVPGGGVR